MVQRIAVLPGDGIGVEVMDSAMQVLDAMGELDLVCTEFDWSCRRYTETGTMMPAGGLETLAKHDAVLLGAVGWPGVPDHVSLWELLIPIRRTFRQYVNLRPVRTYPGVPCPLAQGGQGDVDLVVVRENNEGEYSEVGGRLYRSFPQEMAVQESVFTRTGVARIADYAFELAASRRRHVVSATKSDGIRHTMPFWDEVVTRRALAFATVQWRSEHIDALAAKLVLDPGSFDVILASNLFGDIVSKLVAAVAGSIGIAASANLDPTRQHPSMFEPVHGSAPDIAGQGVANPVGMLASVVLMLQHLGHAAAATALDTALVRSLADERTRTPDLGGTATTADVTRFVISAL
ncbi:MAG TPA: tartrate dehydrogenase [Pseudonocardiaceae bacterium]|jgi:tartrate dehydrogenase/decarboxylase/D-malate dehydrogenase|nr:tartrate dehydrogenase [Pseudonocardiaceae bacterium]